MLFYHNVLQIIKYIKYNSIEFRSRRSMHSIRIKHNCICRLPCYLLTEFQICVPLLSLKTGHFKDTHAEHTQSLI